MFQPFRILEKTFPDCCLDITNTHKDRSRKYTSTVSSRTISFRTAFPMTVSQRNVLEIFFLSKTFSICALMILRDNTSTICEMIFHKNYYWQRHIRMCHYAINYYCDDLAVPHNNFPTI